MTDHSPRRALISVSDKAGLGPFASGLAKLGFELISTGGTRRFLEELQIPVIDISEYTGFPEIMDGRVKTLHPKVHGAILGRPDLEKDAAAIAEHSIVPFQVVVCNLYPFEETISRPDVKIPDAIEQIDIGGPSMVRSAAKNHKYVAIVTKPSQYDDVLVRLEDDDLDERFRRLLAADAFEMTARYDRAISDYLHQVTAAEEDRVFPKTIGITVEKQLNLRYGENPHQGAAFYAELTPPAGSLATTEQIHGKELSYNNLLDLDAALIIARDFEHPAAAVLKHNNPCGLAIAESLSEAFHKAYEGDAVSAFGSIIGLNRTLDLKTAEQMCEPGRFIEAIIAPGFDEDALEALTTRPKWKNNVRLVRCPAMLDEQPHSFDIRRVTGGLLVQERDERPEQFSEWKVVTEREPNEAEWWDLKFGWTACKHVKSNAIVYLKNGMVVGVGAGQMSRLDSAMIAAYKSGERSQGGAVASDAFFPFRDGIDEAAKAGIKAVIQPGGSRNDEEVIDACNEHGMAMVFTGRRHFKH